MSASSGGAAALSRRLMVACMVAFVLFSASAATAAPPKPIAPDKVPVLLIDGGLGDAQYYVRYWLGSETPVAAQGSVKLVTGTSPAWWQGDGSPDTYLLTSNGPVEGSTGFEPLGTEQIIWALDQIAARHPEGKTVIVAEGAAGLVAREYVGDLGRKFESMRADVVGLVLLGTPNQGLKLMDQYPQTGIYSWYLLWSGLSPEDARPGSTYLKRVDSGRFPAVVKTLVVEGSTATFKGMQTDGVTVLGESRLTSGVAPGPVDYVQVACAASQARALPKDWAPYVNMVNGSANELPESEVAKLGTLGYASSAEVIAAVRTYYDAWFAKGAPTTHISSRLVIDVSGSMREDIGSVTKLAGAQLAARGFVDALASRVSMPTAIPEDLGLIVFNSAAREAAPAWSDPKTVTTAIAGLKASGNTDVGLALTKAIDSFAKSPRYADRVVVFLSDGVNTAGLDQPAVLAGPVAKAKKLGVRVNTIALGGTVGEADVAFLQSIAKNTGGTFSQARDVYELRRDFLRARYASLGDLSVDEEVALNGSVSVPLGDADAATRMIEVGVVPDLKGAAWQVLCNGAPVPKAAARTAVNADGTYSIQVLSPQPGSYSVKLVSAGGSKKAHVFAVVQRDAFARVLSEKLPDSSAKMLLIGLGAVLVLGIAATVVLSRRKSAPPAENDRFASVEQAPEEGEQ